MFFSIPDFWYLTFFWFGMFSAFAVIFGSAR